MAEDFSIYYHYGGRLTKLDGDMHYLGGNIKRRHHIDPDKVGFLDLKDDIEDMGYVGFFYRIPGVSLIEGLREMHDDTQVLKMLDYINAENELIEVYVDAYSVHMLMFVNQQVRKKL